MSDRQIFLYFMQEQRIGNPAEDLIKIGYSRDVKNRRMRLQTERRVPVIILAAFPGTPAEEKGLHRLFSAFRGGGEWFRPCEGIAKIIQSGRLPRLPEIIASREEWSVSVSFPLSDVEHRFLSRLELLVRKQNRTLKDFVRTAIEEKLTRDHLATADSSHT